MASGEFEQDVWIRKKQELHEWINFETEEDIWTLAGLCSKAGDHSDDALRKHASTRPCLNIEQTTQGD